MEQVVLMPYDPRWPHIFADESRRVRNALMPFGFESVEHVGSTAIPGMRSKPIVDIMAGINTMKNLPAPNDCLWSSLHYEWGHGPERPTEWFYFIKRDSAGERMAHLHVVPFNGDFWRRMITFRDALLEDASLARKYEDLKIRLAAQFGHDRLRYLAGKESFVVDVVDRRLAQ